MTRRRKMLVADLIACWLSDQIPIADWARHLDETPGLREAWEARKERSDD